MSPLTTPYSGRVAGGGMGAVRTASPASAPNHRGWRGFTPFGRVSITRNPQIQTFSYFRYGFGRFLGLGACRVSSMAAAVARSANGEA